MQNIKKNEKVQLYFLLARVKNLELKGRPNVCVQIVCTDKCKVVYSAHKNAF